LADVLRQFDSARFDPLSIRAFALKFDRKVFEKQLHEFVDSVKPR
jgi:hypothetical protein